MGYLREVMRDEWEVMGGQWDIMGGQWEVRDTVPSRPIRHIGLSVPISLKLFNKDLAIPK